MVAFLKVHDLQKRIACVLFQFNFMSTVEKNSLKRVDIFRNFNRIYSEPELNLLNNLFISRFYNSMNEQ